MGDLNKNHNKKLYQAKQNFQHVGTGTVENKVGSRFIKNKITNIFHSVSPIETIKTFRFKNICWS